MKQDSRVFARRSEGGRRGMDAERGDAITSRDNKWLKLFRGALRGTGPRPGEAIGVEGPKFIEDALRCGLEADALLVSESGERHAAGVLRAAGESEAGIARSRVLRTTDKLFQSVAGTDAPQGIAALFHQPEWSLQDVLRGAGTMRESAALVMVLAEVQDPGNVGTALRSAEAFGATGAIVTRGTADPWSPKALRASAGSALRLPIMRGLAIPILLAQLRVAGVRIYAAKSAPGANDPGCAASGIFVQADLREAAAVFVGSEGGGVPEQVLHAADAIISIPTSAAVESLNAGVAASIVLYEAARQRAEQTKATFER